MLYTKKFLNAQY